MSRRPSSKSKQDSPTTSPPRELSPRVKLIVSLIVLFHLTGLVIALSINVSPSNVQAALLKIASPYQVSTGQDLVMLPLGWTEAKSNERPLDVQVRFDDDTTWYSVTNLGSSETSMPNGRWSNFSRLLSWITEVESSSQIVAEFATQFSRLAESKRRGKVTNVRFRQFVSPSYEVYLQDPSAEEFETIFEAKVVHGEGSDLAIVPVSSPELTSKPLGSKGAGE